MAKISPTYYACICQECGEAFQCTEPDAKLCDDCLAEAEDEDNEFAED